ncbi:hypothetical protein LR48_Vigan05g114400 [Vigna angularis]|uniref:Rab-GAP TBC domain-containing protein n=1 Tax=Phaseolus angularis TaxID=3914 RepID=A0A0L9UKZ4_PHAAN|nr:hypothetical protein LR48_Vigan05g114400 [Vigna angularis]
MAGPELLVTYETWVPHLATLTRVYPLHRLKDSQNSGKGKGLLRKAKRFKKFRERKGLIEKDVVRIDRSIPFYEGDDNPNVNILRDILLTYSFYNFDLGYCQNMYVVTTAGMGILMAIIFLNHVYFETMNHYASYSFHMLSYSLPPLVRLSE